MRSRVTLVTCGPDAPAYDHGPEHPLRPARLSLARDLMEKYGLLDEPWVDELVARDATAEEIGLVHSPGYVDAVRRAGHGEGGDWARFGFGGRDNPIFGGMHEATARVVGASLAAAECVLSGRVEHAFNPAGGLHHAFPEQARGFCIYNDPAIVIAWLLRQGVDRVAYVDVDVHHGDGPQLVFYDDPRVLTVSIHESGTTLPPGTGFVHELGGPGAEGTNVNVPLPACTGDDGWLRAFRRVVPRLVLRFHPDVLVTQLGCDTHHSDPLGHLQLTTAAYRETASLLHELAHGACGGRWVAMGGGGYQWASVVPRAWTIYFAEMVGVEVPDQLPASWLTEAERQAGIELPSRLSEPRPESPSAEPGLVEGVIDEVRRTVFPSLRRLAR